MRGGGSLKKKKQCKEAEKENSNQFLPKLQSFQAISSEENHDATLLVGLLGREGVFVYVKSL